MYLRNRFLGGLSSFALFAPEGAAGGAAAGGAGDGAGAAGAAGGAAAAAGGAAAGGAGAAAASGGAAGDGAGAAAGGAAAGAGGAAAGAEGAVVDWRAGLEGEQLEFAKRAASPADVVKIALDLRKANGSMVRVPAADAKPEDVAKFHAAIGVPKTAEEYKPDLGRDLTDADKAVFTPIAKIMHANGVPAAAFTAVSKAVHELAVAQLNEQNRVAVEARTNNEAALKKEWGADYEGNVAVAQRALTQFGGEDLTQVLNSTVVNGQKLGDHPAIIKAFGKVGRSMGEGDFIGAVGADQRSSINAQIDRLMADNPPGTEKYKAVAAQVAALTEQLHGTGPIVGRGRAA